MKSSASLKDVNQASSGSLLEELRAKIALRNKPVDAQPGEGFCIKSGAQTTSNSKTQAFYNTTNNSNNKLSEKHTFQMDGRNWSSRPCSSGANNEFPPINQGRVYQQPPNMLRKPIPLSNDFTLPPIRCPPPVIASNNFSKLNVNSGRCNSPNFHLPKINGALPRESQMLDFRPPSAMPTFTDRKNSRCFTPHLLPNQWKNPLEKVPGQRPFTSSKPVGLEMPKEKADFHLPPLEFKPDRNNFPRHPHQDRPMSSNSYGSSQYDPTPSVLEAVKFFEQNAHHHGPKPKVNDFKLKPGYYTNHVQVANKPDDDQPTRLRKIRKTVQKFDLAASPVNRNSAIGIISHQGSETLVGHTNHETGSGSGSFIDFENRKSHQNTDIDRASLIRVTKFKATKPTKKASRNRLPRTAKKNLNEGPFGSNNSPSDDTFLSERNNPRIQESSSDDWPPLPISKPAWMRRIVETADVQPSVCDIWDNVNYQMGRKLRSAHAQKEDDNNNDDGDIRNIRME